VASNAEIFERIAERLHVGIVNTVDLAANMILVKAQEDAPVRRIFKGGKARSRPLTKAEIKEDAEVRVRLGLGLAVFGTNRTTTKRGSGNAFEQNSNPHFGSVFGTGVEKAKAARREALNDRKARRDKKGRDIRAAIPALPNARNLEVTDAGNLSGRLQFGKSVEQALNPRGIADLRHKRVFSFSVLAFRESTGRLERHGARPTLGGTLKREIHMTPLKDTAEFISREVVSPTDYAKYVEFGTRHAASQPYLRPAVAHAREKFHGLMQAAIVRAQREMRSSTTTGAAEVQLRILKREKAMFKKLSKRPR